MWEKLLVTSSKKIGPWVIFGPRTRDHEPITQPIHWLDVSGTSDIFSFWGHVILWIIVRATSVEHLLHSFNKYPQVPTGTGGWLRVNPRKLLSDRGWPIWLPAMWTHLCGLCTTWVLLFLFWVLRLLNCNPSSHTCPRSLHIFGSWSVGEVQWGGKQGGKWRTSHRAKWGFFLFPSLRSGQLNMT